MFIVERMGHMNRILVESHGRRSRKSKKKKEDEGKTLESTHFVVSHYNIGINEDLFKASIDSWRDVWLLDTSATCHMTLWRDLFQELNDNVEGAVYFVDRSSLKPI